MWCYEKSKQFISQKLFEVSTMFYSNNAITIDQELHYLQAWYSILWYLSNPKYSLWDKDTIYVKIA